MDYTLRNNARTNHIDGLTKADGSPACRFLNRMGNLTFEQQSSTDLAGVLAAAERDAASNGRKVCATCRSAAVRAIAEAGIQADAAANANAARIAAAGAKAGALNTHLSPTAQAVVAAAAARDEAMTIAYEVEGTEAEAAADAAYQAAEAAYRAASDAHRAARKAAGDNV